MSSINKNGWLIIAISGVTCGGKTTLAKRLQKELSNCITISQDVYFYLDDNPKHVKVTDMDHNNYDILSALDMEKMYSDIIDIITKKDIESNSLLSSDSTKNNLSLKILVVEGFTVLNYKPIFEICDLRYQLVLDKDECERRRSTRVYDPPDTPGYFEKCVWPEHCKYNDELKTVSSVTYLDGTKNDIFESVCHDIKLYLK